MKILATITRGIVLDSAEKLSYAGKDMDELIRRIKENAVSDAELSKLGFREVHYEGIAWTEED